MIIDKSNGRLVEIKPLPQKKNLLENFNSTFSRLKNYSAKGHTGTLNSDFAALSIKFSITENDKLILNGSFIFQGSHDGFGNGDVPMFLVLFSTDKEVD